MDTDLLDLALQKINDLEKRLDKYYKLLKLNNELDFVLNGSYILNVDVAYILDGDY